MKNEINDMMYEQDRIVLDHMIDKVDDLLQALRDRGTVKAIKFGSRFLYRPETLDAVIAEYEKTGRDLNA